MRHLAYAQYWDQPAGGNTGRLFLAFGGPVCADRISNCPLDRVLTYKNLIYLLNLQISIFKERWPILSFKKKIKNLTLLNTKYSFANTPYINEYSRASTEYFHTIIPYINKYLFTITQLINKYLCTIIPLNILLCQLTCQSADIMSSLCGVGVRVRVNNFFSKTTRPRDMLFFF